MFLIMEIEDFKLTTSRLLLRPHIEQDAAFMVHLNSDPEINRYTPDGPLENEQQALQIIGSLRSQFKNRKIGRFIVIEMQTQKMLGWCGLKYLENSDEIDLGYRFLKSEWRKGYATEAANRCLEYGFQQLGFDRITARIQPDNAASISVAKKIGMKSVGKVFENDSDYLIYEILNDSYLAL